VVEKIGGLVLGANVIIVECKGILQSIVDRDREEARASKEPAILVECGVILPGILFRMPCGMEARMFQQYQGW
jgi:hypothetical protein